MTKNEKYIVDMYVRYFGKAADAATIATYAEDKKTSVILKNIIADADAEKGQIETADFVNNAFQNLFGRNATTKEMNKYSKVIEKGKNLPINSIVKSAAKVDKAVYNNKKAVALKYAELGGTKELDLSKISKGNLVDLKTVVTLTDLTNAIEDLADNSGIPSSFDGKTFVLTESVDAGKDFTGTTKNDLFIADNSTKTNASAADTLDGGKGTDTFKFYNATAATLPTLKNIENVALYNFAGTALDVTKWDTVETLYVVNATGVGAGTGFELGKKVTTVNFEDIAANQIVTFDKDLTAATVGVNDVIGAAAAAITVKVDGTALKTLTLDASGKASNVNLTQATIETLNITGKANLTLAAGSTLTLVKTVDGSKAEGDLTLSKLATMTSVKTGSGNDTVTVVAAASGDTIDLGAGNDKLVKGAGTIAAGSIIDGGAGIDSLDAALVNSGNAGVFANFETLSLTTGTTLATALDMNLLTKSTITTIAIDYASVAAATSTVRNVSTSQSLTVNADGVSTTLLFKDAAGTADAYTINFAKDAKDTNTDSTVDAGIVIIDKIENVTVNSTGKTTTTQNIIDLRDADAKSLVITGDKALDVTFGTAANAFGTAGASGNGKGVATIDASAATGAVTIDTTNVGIAENGLTIKGGSGDDKITLAQKATVDAGAGDDTITTSTAGGTLTGGTGKDTFDVKAAVATAAGATATEAEAVLTTITDLTAGDKIIFKDQNGAAGGEVFNKTKLNVDGATNLDAALATAFGAGGDGSTAGIISWFQFAGNTYIVEDITSTSTGAGDIVVKINGLVDLTNSALGGAAGNELTIA